MVFEESRECVEDKPRSGMPFISTDLIQLKKEINTVQKLSESCQAILKDHLTVASRMALKI